MLLPNETGTEQTNEPSNAQQVQQQTLSIQGTEGEIITEKEARTFSQHLEDSELVDRLFPFILKKVRAMPDPAMDQLKNELSALEDDLLHLDDPVEQEQEAKKEKYQSDRNRQLLKIQ